MKLSKFLVLFCGVYNICYADVDSSKYLTCFVKAAQYYRVPQEILQAIAYVESRYNPNAYNENSNHSYDIGLMQINSTWLPKLQELNITESMLYDPCQSIYVGAWILANNIKVYGLNWNAVQRYNGDDVELKYATKVYNRIEQTYPELFNQSQAKLIPVTQKSTLINNESIIKNQLTTNDKPKAILPQNASDVVAKTVPDSEQEVNEILIKSGVKIVTTQPKIKLNMRPNISAQDEQDINKILSQSGVNIATVPAKKVAMNLPKQGQVLGISFNQFYTQNQPKTINVFIQKLFANSKKIVALKASNPGKILPSYPTRFILDFDILCNRNINEFCNFYAPSLAKINSDLNIVLLSNGVKTSVKNIPTIIKKHRKILTKNHHNKTAAMLVI